MPTSLAGEYEHKEVDVGLQVRVGRSHMSVPSSTPGTGSPWRCFKHPASSSPLQIQAVPECSSTNDDWLNGAQRRSKLEHQEGSSLPESRQGRINVASGADPASGLREGWRASAPCSHVTQQGGGSAYLFHSQKNVSLHHHSHQVTSYS